MKNRFVLLALLLPIIGACSSDSTSSAPSVPAVTTPAAAATTPAAPATTAAAEATTTAAAAAPTDATTTVAGAPAPTGDGAVGIADFKFDPPTVNVPVGGAVVWTNNDEQQHTATSAGSFDAGAIQPGTSVTVNFDTAGTFTYICSFHPFMTGTVVVG
ncbi:MAG: plastocyanin/azurin family copper-binding protein [Ilumatobacteraceae bacterium]